MADLDTAIRARLHEMQGENYGVQQLVPALFAVLDLHKPTEGWNVGEVVCTCLPDPDDTYMAHRYPCPTVRAIAKALGVEATDG